MKMCPGSAAAYLSCYCIFLRGADSLGAAGRVWCVCVCVRGCSWLWLILNSAAPYLLPAVAQGELLALW